MRVTQLWIKLQMTELPLFPLNTVLFPGMPLNLYIFEERYKTMMNNCIKKREPFGVVLIANEAPDTSRHAKPHHIGCTAQITQVQPLGNGEMNITAIGRDRFQVISLLQDTPYLIADIESYPLPQSFHNHTHAKAKTLKTWINRYLQLLRQLNQTELDPSRLPENPLSLGYLSAVILQIPADVKQNLLAIHDPDLFLEESLKLYRRECAILKATLYPPENIIYHDRYSLS